MNKLSVFLFVPLFIIPLLAAGCGQKQEVEKKIPVIKPSGIVAKDADDAEEEADTEETSSSGEASSKTVTESAIDKAAAIQSAGEKYRPSTPAVETQTQDAKIVQAPKVEAPIPAKEVVIADFDSGDKPNNLGGNFGAWNKDPSDPTQWCKESFDNANKHGDKGFSMKLDYSVQSPNPGLFLFLPDPKHLFRIPQG